jgi:hypothetical protein
MPATSMSARTPERHGFLRPRERNRWEELEPRTLLARLSVGTMPAPDAEPDPPPRDDPSIGIVDRITNDDSSITDDPAAKADAQEPSADAVPTRAFDSTARVDDTPSVTRDAAEPSPSPPAESSAPTRDTDGRAAPVDSVQPTPRPVAIRVARNTDDTVAADTVTLRPRTATTEARSAPQAPAPAEPSPTPVRSQDSAADPVARTETVDAGARNVRTREPSPVADKSPAPTQTKPADDAKPTVESPPTDCTSPRRERHPTDECQSNQPITLDQSPTDDRTTDSVPVVTAREEPIQIPHQTVEMVPEETTRTETATTTAPVGNPVTDSRPSTQGSTDLPSMLEESAPKDSLKDSNEEGKPSRGASNVIAAGVLSVAFTRPITRLTDPSAALFTHPSSVVPVPLLVPRRRRRSSTKDKTKPHPDDFEGSDEFVPDAWDWDYAAHAGIECASPLPVAYDHCDAAIVLLLDSKHDDPPHEETHERSLGTSMKSFTAGLFTAAVAIFTGHGVRESRRRMPTIKPAVPSYLGPTELAPV